MSEQNQMAISPVTAGLTGAAIGGIGNYFLGVGAAPKKGYKDAKELLTLEPDKFEKLKKEIDASDNNDAKIEFKKVEDGRKIVSSAGETLEKEQATARKEMNAAIEKAVADKTITAGADAEKKALEEALNKTEELRKQMGGLELQKDTDGKFTVTHAAGENAEVKAKRDELKQARENARKAITEKTDSGLGKELKDAQDELAKATTDEAKKAAQEKIDKANVKIAKEVSANADVKKAKDALNVERKKVMTEEALKPFKERNAKRTAYNEKLVSSADEALKDVTAKSDGNALEKLKADINNWKTKLAEKVDDVKAKKIEALMSDDGVDGVKLKDLDTGKFKKFLPKAKTWPTVIAAAALGLAGVALAYMVGPKNATPADVA